MFNKALTLGKITELALANEGAIAGQNKPKSTILFDESLILALDFEQEEIGRTVDDVTCSKVSGIVIGEHPQSVRFVAYDEPNTAMKSYTQCSEKVSECPVYKTMTMENAIQ